MFRVQSKDRPAIRIGSILLATALLLLSASTALAGDSDEAEGLMDYLPEDSRTAGVIDVQKLRKSKYFEEAFDAVEQQAADDEFGKLLQKQGEFDLKSDLHKMAVGMPVAQVKGQNAPDKVVFVMTGDFKRDKLNKLIEKEVDEVEKRELTGDLEGYGKEDIEFALTDDHFFVVRGDDSYRSDAWNVIDGDGDSFTKSAKAHNLFSHLNTERAFWITARPPAGSPQAKGIESAGVAVDVGSGLDIQVVSHTDSKDKADEMISQLEKAKKQGASNAMLSMFGATPLVTNLEFEKSGKAVVATTSMTNSEFDSMITSVKQFINSQKKKQQQGGDESLPIPKESDDSKGGSKDSNDDGADADFN